jgi:hypothetical protein
MCHAANIRNVKAMCPLRVFVVKGGFQGGAEGAVPPLILEKFLLKF